MSKYPVIPEDDAEEEINLKYLPKQKVKIKEHFNRTPLFAYDYVWVNDDKHSFYNPEFDQNDYRVYFSQVKKLSKISLLQLIENHRNSDHFHINDPKPYMKGILETTFGRKIEYQDLPPVGQFHLYTTSEEGKKSPRIHFFLGPYSVFYILIYDPYHEVYPMSVPKK